MRFKGAVAVFCITAAQGWAQSAPALTPRTVPDVGASKLEQRYVYAPPDKGSFDLDLHIGFSAPNEVAIEEPSMCGATAKARVKYDKARGFVELEAWFSKGALPYKFSYTRTRDISTPYNQHPMSIQDGKWQLWFMGALQGKEITFYYSLFTLQLLGSEFDFPGGPPPNSIPVDVPVAQMMCTPIFEGKPDGSAHVKFRYDYAQLRDDRGTAGAFVTFLPLNLCEPDRLQAWYHNGGLPLSEALSFDDVLKSIWSGVGMGIASSVEPDPKPAYINSRDNLMTAWLGFYPQRVPNRIGVDLLTNTYVADPQCGPTRELRDFPAAYYNLCGAP